MSKFFWSALILFSFLGQMSQAKLGETEAQCISRYGDEFEVQTNLGFDVIGDKAASFNLKTSEGVLVVQVFFLNGLDSQEKITCADSSRGISEKEKKNIFDAEGAGEVWTKTKTTYKTDRSDVTFETEDWLRSDDATATCWMSGKNQSNGWNEIDLATREYSVEQRSLDKESGTR